MCRVKNQESRRVAMYDVTSYLDRKLLAVKKSNEISILLNFIFVFVFIFDINLHFSKNK